MTALIEGFTRHMNVIAFIKLIRTETGAGLADTKEQVDGLLEGKPFRITFRDQESANRFLENATKLGALVREVPDD